MVQPDIPSDDGADDGADGDPSDREVFDLASILDARLDVRPGNDRKPGPHPVGGDPERPQRIRPAGTPRPEQVAQPVTDSTLIMRSAPDSYQAEQYRSFRTNLVALNPSGGARTVLFVSADPEAGKSTTVSNVGLALAERPEAKICLVDGDLRMPRLHELFEVPCEPGLADVLFDRVSPATVMQSTGLPNLGLITAGRENESASEAISSPYMVNLIGYLKQQYDYILFDSPPLLLYADGADLSKLVDDVILLVAMEQTPKREVEDALRRITAAGGNLVGSFVTGSRTHEPERVYVQGPV